MTRVDAVLCESAATSPGGWASVGFCPWSLNPGPGRGKGSSWVNEPVPALRKESWLGVVHRDQ